MQMQCNYIMVNSFVDWMVGASGEMIALMTKELPVVSLNLWGLLEFILLEKVANDNQQSTRASCDPHA